MTRSSHRLVSGPRIHLAALAVASLALFVALGGSSYAAGIFIGTKQIKANAVTSKKIKDGHVRSSDVKNAGIESIDVKDGAIELVDISGPLQAKIGQLVDGSVTTAKLANNSVTSPKVAPNTLTSGDLATGAVNGSELAGNAVEGDEVENGSLDAVDVGRFSGSVTRNFGVIASGTCGFVMIDPTPGVENIENSPSSVTPGPEFGGNASFHAEAEGGSLRLKACNVTGGPIDPDGAAGTNYNYIVFG